ncbi:MULTISPECIES: TniQ family protein [unclassified Pseudomonas]|uniref:TniQ family protein n=1 Tax=unclassified Pseudomonas TaxID=196821 RepID=UPI0030D6EE83
MKIFTPFPGEYVASALQRGNEMLGLKNLTEKDFYIKPVPRKGFGYALGDKCEWRNHAIFQFPHFFTERHVSEEVLQNFTLYPLTTALGRTRADIVVTPREWKKICPSCVLEDFESYGTAYVHRRHVPASVRVCSIHNLKLMDTCTTCSMPMNKHQLSKLGVCSRKYQFKFVESDSFSLAYSKFIADLLKYDGPTTKSHQADWAIFSSIRLKYGTEIRQDDEFIPNFIKSEFGVDVKHPARTYSDNNYTILAFLGCETAERYLNLIFKTEESSRLGKDLKSLYYGL